MTATGSGHAFDREPVTSRAQAVDLVRRRGALSRVELSAITGLSPPAVSAVIRRLLDDGLLTEVGRGESTGGKPPTLIRIEPTARYVVGVHLGFHATTLVVLDFAGNLVARWRRRAALADNHPAEQISRLVAEIDNLFDLAAVDRTRLLGVGIATPGPVSRDTGLLSSPPNMQGWAGYPLRGALEQALAVPVLLDNDASSAAAGTRLSTEHKERTVAVLFMSDAVGGGLRVDGDIFAGAHGNAVEVGHTCVDIDGPPCWCGARGCLEAVAGPRAMVEQARAAGVLQPSGDPSSLAEFWTLARKALGGDAAAQQIIADSARWMAVGAQSLTAMLDVELLVLTGPSFAVAGSLYLPAIRERVAQSVYSRATGVEVVVDERGHDAAAIGAASMMLRSETAAA